MDEQYTYLVNENAGAICISAPGKALPRLMAFLTGLGYRTATHAEFSQALYYAELAKAAEEST